MADTGSSVVELTFCTVLRVNLSDPFRKPLREGC